MQIYTLQETYYKSEFLKIIHHQGLLSKVDANNFSDLVIFGVHLYLYLCFFGF